jgi:SAM-dependent methyltransferase
MSADADIILEAIPAGKGLALDLGGGRGMLRPSLVALGYGYVNIDMGPPFSGEPSVLGDAHDLPFKDGAIALVVSKDTLEHFLRPRAVLDEVHRVLAGDGLLVIWVPFMHPFHGNDLYRYTPLGLKKLLAGFQILRFDSPLWVFTVMGTALNQILKRLHLGILTGPLRRLCNRTDRLLARGRNKPSGFAAGYRIVARKTTTLDGNGAQIRADTRR